MMVVVGFCAVHSVKTGAGVHSFGCPGCFYTVLPTGLEAAAAHGFDVGDAKLTYPMHCKLDLLSTVRLCKSLACGYW